METTNQQIVQPSTQENNQPETVAKPKNKPWVAILVILVVTLSAVSLVLAYFLIKPQLNLGNQVTGCTEEAKICPDGSNVGRSGPNCEFAPCPTNTPSATQESEAINGWQTYKNETYGFSFNYPDALKLDDITASQDIMVPLYISVTNDNSKILLSIEKRMCNSGKEWSSYKIDNTEALRNNILDVMNGEYFAYDTVEVSMVANHCLSIEKYTSTSDEKAKDTLLSIDKIQFDQILSTFRFADKINNPTTMNNWQRYENVIFGIGFNYPYDWQLKDTLPLTYVPIVNSNQGLTLTSDDGSTLYVGINHDGDGPFFDNKSYDYQYFDDKGIAVTKEVINNLAGNENPSVFSIGPIAYDQKIGAKNLMLRYSFDKKLDQIKQEELFKQILATFELK